MIVVLKVSSTVMSLVAPLLLRSKTFIEFMKVVWKFKPVYLLSSVSLFSWAVVMWYQENIAVSTIYPLFSLLPFPISTAIYIVTGGAWPFLFYRGWFRAARTSILAQGLIHVCNGMTFIPTIIYDFPGALPRAIFHVLLGAILISSWHDTPLIEKSKTLI